VIQEGQGEEEEKEEEREEEEEEEGLMFANGTNTR
jgi:hypothetical protein